MKSICWFTLHQNIIPFDHFSMFSPLHPYTIHKYTNLCGKSQVIHLINDYLSWRDSLRWLKGRLDQKAKYHIIHIQYTEVNHFQHSSDGNDDATFSHNIVRSNLEKKCNMVKSTVFWKKFRRDLWVDFFKM